MVESAAHVEHVFAADELFFSTTDSHGRIRRANSTFMRLSGYPRGALVGRAHNVVRHADMPAGLFRSIWDAIEEGRAASAGGKAAEKGMAARVVEACERLGSVGSARK